MGGKKKSNRIRHILLRLKSSIASYIADEECRINGRLVKENNEKKKKKLPLWRHISPERILFIREGQI